MDTEFPPVAASGSDAERPRLRETWLLDRRTSAVLSLAYIALTGVWYVVGWSITHVFDSSIGRTDGRLARWFVDQRTASLNRASLLGSDLGETITKIAVTAILATVLLFVVKRWLEPLLLVVSLVLEAMVFITVTWLVDRPRPMVPHLDSSPVGSSFPSGHTAAAACYAAIAVVIFWHTRKLWIRIVTVVLTVSIPVAVAVSRMYRGMHHLSDVIGGALLGAAAVIITTKVLQHASERHHADRTNDVGAPEATDDTVTEGKVSPS